MAEHVSSCRTDTNGRSHAPPFSAAQALTLGLALLLVASCAVPQPPPGGPRDVAPPLIINVNPEPGEVNVERESITMEFDKYIDRSSFEQALSFTPRFQESPTISWSGRSVEVTFPEELRDDVTYIVTLDTDLRDERGNNLRNPVNIAFSTGPEINEGEIDGLVVNAGDGSPREGIDVFAYAHPDSASPAELDSLPEEPDYRTQTGSEGAFSFEYLEEQPYYVIAVQDDNRNLRPDPGEEFAVPPESLIVADRDGTTLDVPWVVTRLDTIPPELMRVDARSEQRHELRFDQPITVANRTPERWAVRDSLQDERREINAVYHPPGARNTLVVRTEPLDATTHELTIPDSTIADTTGNLMADTTASFTPSEDPDTMRTRFRAFLPEHTEGGEDGVHTLLPQETPAVRLNQPFTGYSGLPERDSTHLHDVIAARDSVGDPRSFELTSGDGATYHLRFTPSLASEEEVDIRVSGAALQDPDTTFARTYQRISDRELGALGGAALWPDDDLPDTDVLAAPDEQNNPTSGRTDRPPVVVEAYAVDNGDRPMEPLRTVANPEGQFLIDQLPERTFRFRAFGDYSGDGQWDGGQIVPYRPAEPITWGDETPEVRPRWETMLEAPLRLPEIER